MKKILVLFLLLSLNSCYIYDSIGYEPAQRNYEYRYRYYEYPNSFWYRPYEREIIIVNPRKQTGPRSNAPIRQFEYKGRNR